MKWVHTGEILMIEMFVRDCKFIHMVSLAVFLKQFIQIVEPKMMVAQIKSQSRKMKNSISSSGNTSIFARYFQCAFGKLS